MGDLLTMRTITFPSTDAGHSAVIKVQICNTSLLALAVNVALSTHSSNSFSVKPSHRAFTLQPKKFCMLPVSFCPPPWPNGDLRSNDHSKDENLISKTSLARLTCVLKVSGAVLSPAGDAEELKGVSTTGDVKSNGGLKLLLQALLVGDSPVSVEGISTQ